MPAHKQPRAAVHAELQLKEPGDLGNTQVDKGRGNDAHQGIHEPTIAPFLRGVLGIKQYQERKSQEGHEECAQNAVANDQPGGLAQQQEQHRREGQPDEVSAVVLTARAGAGVALWEVLQVANVVCKHEGHTVPHAQAGRECGREEAHDEPLRNKGSVASLQHVRHVHQALVVIGDSNIGAVQKLGTKD